MLPVYSTITQHHQTMKEFKDMHTEQEESRSSNEPVNDSGGVDFTDKAIDAEEMTGTAEGIQAELADQKERYLRLYAEFDNFKRRSARERVELMQTAGKEVITSLLDVLDDCDRAEKQIKEDDMHDDPIHEGVLLIFNKLKTILAAKGLKPMECVGQEFNPDEQEALSQVPVTDEQLKGKVIDEIVKGYYLNDKIIRHAKVVVGA